MNAVRVANFARVSFEFIDFDRLFGKPSISGIFYLSGGTRVHDVRVYRVTCGASKIGLFRLKWLVDNQIGSCVG